jgi:hypothetical protein
MDGMAVGSCAQFPPNCRNVLEKETTRPSSSAPRYVSGRLRSRPTAAAANESMISRLSV